MSLQPGSPAVCLLRSASGEPDPYVEALAERGFRAACVPVLRFGFPAQEKLSALLAGPSRYGGLILTSPRAAEALAEALAERPGERAAWTAKPAYAVGPRTAEALAEAGFAPRGETSGNAEALSAHIAGGHAPDAPLLFLSGNRRRNALPRALASSAVAFEELVVYETHPRSDLDFADEQAFPGKWPDWLAFFSPSGIEAVRQARGIDRRAVRNAAIGPTTAAALEAAGFSVAAVAEAPTPEALAEALREA